MLNLKNVKNRVSCKVDFELHKMIIQIDKVSVVKSRGKIVKCGQMNFLHVLGTKITCTSEWASLVNPWTKKIDCIVGVHKPIDINHCKEISGGDLTVAKYRHACLARAKLNQKAQDILTNLAALMLQV